MLKNAPQIYAIACSGSAVAAGRYFLNCERTTAASNHFAFQKPSEGTMMVGCSVAIESTE